MSTPEELNSPASPKSSSPPPLPTDYKDKANADSSKEDAEKKDEREPSTYATGTADFALNDKVVAVLKTVFDPEIPVNIYEMGMIYEVRVDTEGSAYVKMTLTSPACPVAGELPGEVEAKVRGVEGVSEAKVELVWEPTWTMDLVSEAARLQLNL